jgi:hypothetical protein
MAKVPSLAPTSHPSCDSRAAYDTRRLRIVHNLRRQSSDGTVRRFGTGGGGAWPAFLGGGGGRLVMVAGGGAAADTVAVSGGGACGACD